MSAIIGISGLLLESDLTPPQRDDVQTVHNSAVALLDIINDVLDYSKMESGTLHMEVVPFDLRECLDAAHGLLSNQATQKGLSFALQYPAHLPSRFLGTPGRIRQIILNFTSNAIKFTDNGAVRIVVTTSAHGQNVVLVRISVQDTGPGISQELQAKLFQRFVQADTSTTRKHGGTGLGLAISKSLAELMGGTVGLRSEGEHGSEFWVEIPLQLPPDEQRADGADSGTVSIDQFDGSLFRVLVAEDNAVNQKIAARLLQKIGIRADIAANGKEALRMLNERPYNLILMDCQMPEMDGYEATRAIRRAGSPTTQIPIIAVTAHAGAEERRRCLAAGMDDFISKPFTGSDFLKTVIGWLCTIPRGARVPRTRLRT